MISVLTILCLLAILFIFQILCLLPGICFQEWWRFLLFQGAELVSHLPPLKARIMNMDYWARPDWEKVVVEKFYII